MLEGGCDYVMTWPKSEKDSVAVVIIVSCESASLESYLLILALGWMFFFPHSFCFGEDFC